MSEPDGTPGTERSTPATDAPTADPDAIARKRYLDRIAEIGRRSEKVGLPILTALLLLFFGFILPSARVVEQVRKLRAQRDASTRVERRLRALETSAPEEWGRPRSVIRLAAIESLASLKQPAGGSVPYTAADVSAATEKARKAIAATASGAEAKSHVAIVEHSLEVPEFPLRPDELCHGLEQLHAAIPPRLLPVAKACAELLGLLAKARDDDAAECARQRPLMDKQLNDAHTAMEKTLLEKEQATEPVEIVDRETRELQRDCSSFFTGQKQCVPNDAAEIRRICRGVALLKAEARRKQSAVELRRVGASGVSLKFLGPLGIDLGGFDDLQLPLTYLPLGWSVLLLFLLLRLSNARASMLNLYARALRARPVGGDQGRIVDEIGGVPHAPWWWIAPLPGRSGRFVDAPTLRDRLGWRGFGFAAAAGTVALFLALVALQAAVLAIAAQLAHAFADGVDGQASGEVARVASNAMARTLAARGARWELEALIGGIGVLTLVNVALAIRWLLAPFSRVPDEDPNDEAPWRYRRLVLGAITFGVVGFLLFRPRSGGTLPTAAIVERKPRYRKKKARFISAGTLAPGFYRNPAQSTAQSKPRRPVIHYVAPNPYPSIAHPTREHPRYKPNVRKPLIRRETRALRAEVAVWSDHDGNKRHRPRRKRQPRPPETARREPPPPAVWPAGNRIRHATGLHLDRLVPIELKALLEMPAAQGGAGPAAGAAVGSEAWRQLHQSERAFAVEQEALRLLAGTRADSDSDDATKIDEACALLMLAIRRLDNLRHAIRLCDLLAVVAVRKKRPAVLDQLVQCTEERLKAIDEAGGHRWTVLAARLQQWKHPSSNWHKRWQQRTKWAGLPM